MSGILSIDELRATKIKSSGDLIFMANNASFMTLNATGNKVEFHANVDANNFDLTEADVKISAINDTPIGLTTQREGRFSSLTATGNAFLNGNATVGGHTQLSGGLLVNSTATFNNEVNFNASVSFEDFDVGNLNVSNVVVEADARVNGNTVCAGSLQCSGGLTVNSTAVFNNPITVANELTVSAGGELDVASGTLTLANDSISGNAINGGTIGSIRIEQLSGAMDCQNNAMTNINIDSGNISGCDIVMTGKTLTLDNDAISGDKVEGGTIASITISQLGGAINFNNEDMTNVDINSGAIDGTNITVGAGKTLDVSGGTLTLANNQISGDKVEGGTINSITIETLGGALDCNNQAFTNINIDGPGSIENTDITVGTGKTLTLTAGTLATSASQKIAIVEGCASNLDIGSFLFRAQTLQADNQTEGRLAIYGSAGLLSEDGDILVANSTLVSGKKVSVKNGFYRKAISTNEGTHSAGKTLTGAQLLNRLWRGVPNSALNITFPDASALVSAMPECVVGSILNFTIMNLATSGSKDYTIVSGAGMNYISSGTGDHNKVKTKKAKNFLIELTNVGSGTEGYNVYVLGDSTPI